MANDWDYSMLTHAAHEAGGPDKYVEGLSRDGFRKGSAAGALAALAVAGAVTVLSNLYSRWKSSRDAKAIGKDVDSADGDAPTDGSDE